MKKFISRVFIVITFCAVVTYLITSCTPYINPSWFWPMTFLALGFPIIAVTFLVFCFIWLMIRWRIGLALFVLFLVAGYPNLHSTFGANIPKDFNYKKDKNVLRVMTWNVRYFDNNNKAADSPTAVRRQMINYIKKADPDVMMFQDYLDYHSPSTMSNIETMRDSLGYKYCYTTKDVVDRTSMATTEHGVAIYSKYPIIDSGKVLFEHVLESVGYADILFQNKPIRFFTTHLLSMSIHPGSQLKIANEQYHSALEYGENVLDRLKGFDQYHARQAILVRKQESKSPYPVIVAGDFNSVPSSYVYHTIKGNLQDVFVKKGWRLGHTYFALSKTLRIDYLLVDPKFKVEQVTTPKLFLSDHFPVVADIEWKK